MTKISALPAASPLDGTETIPAVQGGTTVGATVDDLAPAVLGGLTVESPLEFDPASSTLSLSVPLLLARYQAALGGNQII